MTVADAELESAEPVLASYPTGGEVSALTLIEDVRAIRQRLDAIEVALRGLSLKMEELPSPSTAAGASAAPVESLDELRKALTGDLQTDLRRQARQIRLLLAVMLLVTLMGIGGVAWMIHQLE